MAGSTLKLAAMFAVVKRRCDIYYSFGIMRPSAAKELSVFFLSLVIVACGLPRRSAGSDFPTRGKETAESAAGIEGLAAGSMFTRAGSFSLYSLGVDTTQTPLPEDEERNLVKEIAIWAIVATFVGYFLIKVFLEGETEETPPPDQGKSAPPLQSPGVSSRSF